MAQGQGRRDRPSVRRQTDVSRGALLRGQGHRPGAHEDQAIRRLTSPVPSSGRQLQSDGRPQCSTAIRAHSAPGAHAPCRRMRWAMRRFDDRSHPAQAAVRGDRSPDAPAGAGWPAPIVRSARPTERHQRAWPSTSTGTCLRRHATCWRTQRPSVANRMHAPSGRMPPTERGVAGGGAPVRARHDSILAVPAPAVRQPGTRRPSSSKR